MNGKSQKESEELVLTTNCASSFHDEMDALFGNEEKYLLPPCTCREAYEAMRLFNECYKTIK
jgi:hypothetical protein